MLDYKAHIVCWGAMVEVNDRILLHLGDGLRRVVEPGDVFFLEFLSKETRARLRSARALVDVRTAPEVLPLFEPHGFLRIHREYAVNLRRVRLIRRRKGSREWEVKLEPPVNRVLPVSRNALAGLWTAFEQV